jgi:predicted secreted hydrolase
VAVQVPLHTLYVERFVGARLRVAGRTQPAREFASRSRPSKSTLDVTLFDDGKTIELFELRQQDGEVVSTDWLRDNFKNEVVVVDGD